MVEILHAVKVDLADVVHLGGSLVVHRSVDVELYGVRHHGVVLIAKCIACC